MPAEIELKLSIAPEQVARLLRAPALRTASRSRARTQRLHAVYYDTPELALHQDRVALRLRREGRRWVQTLKSAGTVEAGLHQREEVEIAVPMQMLNLQALAASRASAAFSSAEQRQRLQPVFTTSFVRSLRMLEPAPDSRIEFSLDRGIIAANSTTEPICEIELELKAGSSDALMQWALLLIEQVPLRLQPLSKAERGYALAQGDPPAPVKAAPPLLEPGMSVSETFRQLLFGCVAQLQANEDGLLRNEDEEYLHQARVALRRLRSAMSVFAGAFPKSGFTPILAELRWLGSRLGPARDWDVFVTHTLSEIAASSPSDEGLNVLYERAETQRAQANQAACAAVASTRYTALLLKIAQTFTQQPWQAIDDERAAAQRALSLLEFATNTLARRQRKVRTAGRGFRWLDAHGLHQLRIEIKKLRYAVEFFSSLFSKDEVRHYVRELSTLQELLGLLNDAATVGSLCGSLRTPGDTPPVSEALGIVRGWAVAGVRERRHQLDPAWRQLRDGSVFWK